MDARSLEELISGLTPKQIDAQFDELDRTECQDNLYAFLRAAWHTIDPAPWVDGWPIEAVAEHLQAVADGDIKRLIINIPPRMAKQVADDTPVLTPRGWVTHGDLRPGDEVFHPSGRPVKVLAVNEKTPSDIRVEFFDGSVIYCHEDHEWTLYNRPRHAWETVETRQFLQSRRGRWGQTKGQIKGVLSCGRALHQLPLVEPLQFPEASLPIHPYVLGAWLGDGSTGKPCVTHSPKDLEVCARIEALGHPKCAVWTHKDTGVLTTNFARSGMREGLLAAGVLTDKHIPEAYQFASVQQRLDLLAGLIDTDGHVDANGRCSFTNTNERLALGVAELVRSFGWRATVTSRMPNLNKAGPIQGKKRVWLIAFQPTLEIPTAIPRKAVSRFAPRRRIGLKSVTRDPCGKVGNCIEVDAIDGLYLVGKQLTPTHNSSLTSVAFPAWVWAQPKRRHGPNCGPHVQFLHASYAEKLSLRDSVKCRRLIQSPWYQKLWANRFQLSSDQNVKSRFSNDKGGERLITSIGASVTGEGGSIIVIDDPNAANEAFSEATVEATKDWWDQTMSTRLNDPKTGAFIIIQQRLAQDDLTGHIISKSRGEWDWLCLPMHYDPERSSISRIGWTDPRSEPGELLMPDRFGPDEVKSLEVSLGPWAASGQLEQDPKRRGGGVIQRAYWQLWDNEAFPAMDYILASLDTAYTEKEMNDACAMTVWGVFHGTSQMQATRLLDQKGKPLDARGAYVQGAPKVVLLYAWNERLEFPDLLTKVAHVCGAGPLGAKDDKYDLLTKRVPQFPVDMLLVENKAAGISLAQALRKALSGGEFAIQLSDPKSQDKLSRLYAVQHIFADNMVYAPDRPWADMVIDQVEIFPKGAHDDLVDTVSQGIRKLRDMGMLVRPQERLEEIQSMTQYQGRPPMPLYPG